MKQALLLVVIVLATVAPGFSQRKRHTDPSATDTSRPKAAALPAFPMPHQGPKPYKEVITDKAVTHTGLFTVHKVEDKWYFEIPDSIMDREFMAITRFSKTAAGGGIYGGELANEQTLEWEMGPSHTLFLRVVTLVSMADSTNKIYRAVKNSSVDPIAAAFEIR